MARRKTTIYLDDDIRKAAKAVAIASDRSESDVIEDALQTYLGAGQMEAAGEDLRSLFARLAERQKAEPLTDDEAMALANEAVHGVRAERSAAKQRRVLG